MKKINEIYQVGMTVSDVNNQNRLGEVIKVYNKSLVVKFANSKCRYQVHNIKGFVNDLQIINHPVYISRSNCPCLKNRDVCTCEEPF